MAEIVEDNQFWQKNQFLLTGGSGFLGSHIVDRLIKIKHIDTSHLRIIGRKNLDLRVWTNCVAAVKGMDVVIHLAAKVGGIGYNRRFPADLFYDNALMGIQLLEAARQAKVKKFVIVGTVCAYPKFTPVPFSEDNLWNGYPEESNAPYGIAKKILLVQSSAYRQQYGFDSIYLLPVNMYGPRDNFDPENSHVIPALIHKLVNAKMQESQNVTVWGTGNASREFLYVEDAADGIISATESYSKAAPVNLGSGQEVRIKELVDRISELVDYKGEVIWDSSKPDGQPRRCLDISRAKEEFGFVAKTPLELGLKRTLEWYYEKMGLGSIPLNAIRS